MTPQTRLYYSRQDIQILVEQHAAKFSGLEVVEVLVGLDVNATATVRGKPSFVSDNVEGEA
jgi:hypothetical protein